MSSRSVVTLATPDGVGQAHIHVPGDQSRSGAGQTRGTLLLGHGAGGGVDAPDLQALTALTDHGWVAVLLEQPWRVAGRRIAVAPRKLDEATISMLAALEAGPHALPHPWVLGGRSAGARVAARLSSHVQAVCLIAFPLQPPPPKPALSKTGRERAVPGTRAGELLIPLRLGISTLVLQGTVDRFGGPKQISEAAAAYANVLTVRSYPGDHNRNADMSALVSDVGQFLAALP